LPWYEPTRFYHVIDGRHYGWLNPQHAVTWRRPPYFIDVIAPVATLGRGSPTGVVCYRHNQFPPEYQGGFFLGDWTFGKIYFVKPERQGASYRGEPRVFLESQGDNGFAPTACAVDERTGDLYISIGGRGTRGAVYRIRHTQRFESMKGKLAPLPMAKRSLDWNEQTRKEYETTLHSKSAADHLWALQMARRQNSFLGEEGVSSPFANKQYFDDVSIRNAYADLISDLTQAARPDIREAFTRALRNNVQLAQTSSFGLGVLRADPAAALDNGLTLLKKSKIAERRLDGVRLVQLALGDIGARNSIGTIWEGYSARRPTIDDKTAQALASAFPSGHANLDRELARTLGMLTYKDADLRERFLARFSEDSSPSDDVHYLACYALLGGKRANHEAKRVAATLLDLDRKIVARKMNRDSNWQPRIRELYVGLAEKDAALHETMVEHPAFGRPDHALFAAVDGFPKARAARIFLDRWRRDKGYALTAAIVPLFDALPTGDVLPSVRKRWGDIGQESAFLPLLAKSAIAEDRGKFIDGLNSPQSSIVFACVQGLNKIDAKADPNEILGLIRALHRAMDNQPAKRNPVADMARLAKLVSDRLEKSTGESFKTDSKRWIAWFAQKEPELGRRLANPDGVDVAKWEKRLSQINWNAGDAEPGKAVFAKANCVQCHSGSQAVGPDLVGVTNRFSRNDLMTAILQPSKDVPARYQMTIVETKEGKTHQGIVIYDAVDSLILQSPAATLRVNGQAIVSRSVSSQSLMPAGLLDPLSDREIVDLYAYLRSLSK
jgi:putative heme-binding domain-containing protein